MYCKYEEKTSVYEFHYEQLGVIHAAMATLDFSSFWNIPHTSQRQVFAFTVPSA